MEDNPTLAQAFARLGPYRFGYAASYYHAAIGIGFGLLLFWVLFDIVRRGAARGATFEPTGASDILGLLIILIILSLLFAVAALLFILGVLNAARRLKQTPALILDDHGMQGFLWNARGRIAWPDITSVDRLYGWILVRAGRRRLMLNPQELKLGDPDVSSRALLLNFIANERPDLTLPW